jgi:hypothetical protein
LILTLEIKKKAELNLSREESIELRKMPTEKTILLSNVAEKQKNKPNLVPHKLLTKSSSNTLITEMNKTLNIQLKQFFNKIKTIVRTQSARDIGSMQSSQNNILLRSFTIQDELKPSPRESPKPKRSKKKKEKKGGRSCKTNLKAQLKRKNFDEPDVLEESFAKDMKLVIASSSDSDTQNELQKSECSDHSLERKIKIFDPNP